MRNLRLCVYVKVRLGYQKAWICIPIWMYILYIYFVVYKTVCFLGSIQLYLLLNRVKITHLLPVINLIERLLFKLYQQRKYCNSENFRLASFKNIFIFVTPALEMTTAIVHVWLSIWVENGLWYWFHVWNINFYTNSVLHNRSILHKIRQAEV